MVLLGSGSEADISTAARLDNDVSEVVTVTEPTPLAAPARQSKPPDERREEIIRATRELVSEAGVTRLTISRIAARVGVTRGLIYHYFPDLDALVDLICADHIDAFVVDIARWDAEREVGNIDKALFDCIRLFRFHLQEKDLFREDLARTENAALYNRFVDLAVQAIVDVLQATTVEAYARRHQIEIDHVAEVFHVLVHGLIALVRSRPDVADEVLVAIVRQTLHLDAGMPAVDADRAAGAPPKISQPKE